MKTELSMHTYFRKKLYLCNLYNIKLINIKIIKSFLKSN